jgi:membrane-bound ClpP family serine protease
MSRYLRDSVMGFFASTSMVVGAVVAFSLPWRLLGTAVLAGLAAGFALAACDAERIPLRVHIPIFSTSVADQTANLWGRYVVRGLYFLLTPGFQRPTQLGSDAIGISVLAIAVCMAGYSATLAALVLVQERRHGPIAFESMFPGFIGLPEVLHGRSVTIRTAVGTAGTIELDGDLLDVTSVTGHPLIPGQQAILVGVEGASLLVEQRESCDS